MDVETLRKFVKPEKEFLKDKECLICLESVDIEMNQIVMLPCKCANSAYHIPCIINFLQSGEKKNFCPHCKTKYNISPQINYIIVETHQPNNSINIIIFHILFNTTMNIINMWISRDYSAIFEFQMLVLFCVFKIFINFAIFMCCSNTDVEKIKAGLFFSYIFQAVIFGLLIYILAKIKKNSVLTILLLNNLLLTFVDLAFKFITECRMRNRIVAH